MTHAAKTIHIEQLRIQPGTRWSRLPLIAGAVGVLGVGASFALRGSDPEQFAFSWLVAFLYFVSIGLGGLFFVLLHYATKAGWSVVVRRLASTAASVLPLLLVLALPVLLHIHELFPWSHADVVAKDPLLQGKVAWLNTSFFIARSFGYLAVWSLVAVLFRSASRRQDSSGSEATTRRLTFWSGPLIMVFALTLTAASFDWIMSLDPHWYSTIFGVYYFSGSLVGIFAFLILVAGSLDRQGALGGAVTVEHFHDLGKLLFAFVVFWTYIGFSQFFLIWYGNMPEETVWYLHRLEGGWRTITLTLAIGHFAVPFLFLMSRNVKRRRPLLAAGALWMLALHYVDLYWLVMPNLHSHDVHPSLLDLTTFVGVGGLFMAAYAWLLGRSSLVPIGDPRLVESLTFENS